MDALSRTLLVVDDDPSIRLLCRINLELDGWRVHEAESVAEARKRLADDGVRVVLLDVRVGDGSGADFLREIRGAHPHVRVAMLTGSVGTSALDGVVADDVIAKPFTLDQLRETVLGLAG